jgi:subtilase family serine protease
MKGILRVIASLVVMVSAAWGVQPDRIAGAIDSNQTVVVKDSVSPRAQARFDQGPVDPGMKLAYITLQVTPSATQQTALDDLLAAQQDPNSASYHQWLTPEQYAAQFGLSRNDVSQIDSWLQSQGFTVLQNARSRNWIAFAGTAAQVEAAFHTQIHYFNVDGEQHYANATNISLPPALAGVVTTVRGLHDFLWKSFLERRLVGQDGLVNPDYTTGGNNFLAPDDIATIYNIQPLITAGYDGTGMNLVIVGQTDIATTDITQFRSGFNLPAIKLTQVLASGCLDPGITGDQIEADLDLEWSGAVARNATIIFDKCDAAHGGVFTSLQDAITNNRGAVISMSYGGCEPVNGQSNADAIQGIIQQANSQGITFMASAGDDGAAACDSGNPPATGGLEVNLPASVPETTAVGGSEFNEGGNNSTYWGANGPNFGSAKSYIPEEGWNDTHLGGGFASTGGGASIYFTKPTWQTGTGVPNDGHRDVPDVTITASADHDGYILCTQGSCASGIVNAVNNNSIVGGTSASSPVFAGIVTLLNQYLVKNGSISKAGLSNINTTLYSYAASDPTAFHDITQGTNIQPCTPGTPSGYPTGQKCPSGGQFGYTAAAGYDQVTGLGSVNAYNFVTGWASGGSAVPTTTTLTGVSTANVGTTSVTLSATVKATSGTATGTVTFSANGTQVGSPVALNAGKASATYSTGSLPIGTYAITAVYNPTGNFTGSNGSGSLAIQDFTIAANPTTVNVSAPGQNGTTVLTLTPGSSGFSQAITFTCTGLPAKATCAASPVTPGSKVATTTLTITTTATTSQLRRTPLGRGTALFYAMLFPGFLGLISVQRKRTLRGIRLLAMLGALGLCSVWLACGGGSSSSVSGTPTGNSTVTVTASAGTLAHPVTITLAVQ